jgi:hypothetical protein
MAMARAVCASKDMLPKLMAPEMQNYCTYYRMSVLTKHVTEGVSPGQNNKTAISGPLSFTAQSQCCSCARICWI